MFFINSVVREKNKDRLVRDLESGNIWDFVNVELSCKYEEFLNIFFNYLPITINGIKMAKI